MRSFQGFLAAVWSAAVLCSLTSTAQAQVSQFHERFDGAFNEGWLAYLGALPDESLGPFANARVFYVTGLSLPFEQIGNDRVAILSTLNAPSASRFGYVSQAKLTGTVGEVEARINTLDQGDPFIDGLFDLWLVSSEAHDRFVRVGLFGNDFGRARCWTYSSALWGYSTGPEPGALPPFAFQNNTWYRVRITQAAGTNLAVSVWDDAGQTKLVSFTFPHTLADLGSSFQIGFSQWMGGPDRSHHLRSAVDSITASLKP